MVGVGGSETCQPIVIDRCSPSASGLDDRSHAARGGCITARGTGGYGTSLLQLRWSASIVQAPASLSPSGTKGRKSSVLTVRSSARRVSPPLRSRYRSSGFAAARPGCRGRRPATRLRAPGRRCCPARSWLSLSLSHDNDNDGSNEPSPSPFFGSGSAGLVLRAWVASGEVLEGASSGHRWCLRSLGRLCRSLLVCAQRCAGPDRRVAHPRAVHVPTAVQV